MVLDRDTFDGQNYIKDVGIEFIECNVGWWLKFNYMYNF